ncbi:hypothetical protein Tco_0804688 [Tanacetum coccineum]|uniref:Uncharacterized protein n=1 Tax=Tanacetum coccineum TaxID=301880 RepID=A0ABQ5A9B2_9ASTR
MGGKRDPQVRSTLGVQRREGSSGEEHSRSIMAASAIAISSDSSDESTTLFASPTGLCGLIPYSDFDSDSPDEMSSPKHISSLPAISSFLCTDSSEALDSSDGPPSQDPYVMIVARGRRKNRVRPLPARRLAWRRASPRSSTTTHLLLVHLRILRHFILWVWMHQIRLILDLRLELYHLYWVTLRGEHLNIVRHFVIGVLLHYLLCIHDFIKVISGDSSERPLHLSSHSAGPSRKRCRSLVDSVPSCTPVIGSLAPTHADLLPPRKRFRDSYLSEASIEEDTEIDHIETEVDIKLGIGDGDEVRDHVETEPRDVRDDTEEYEADTNAGDTVEVGINPMLAPMVEEEIIEPAG